MKQLLYRSSFVVFLALIFTFSLISMPTQAVTLTVWCNSIALSDAIDLANTNGEPDVINLEAGCTYTFSTAHNGNNALPVITSQIVINGNGATLQRDDGTLRLVTVDTTGDLTLNDVTIRDWNANGAIHNTGNLTVRNSEVVDNAMTGITNTTATATLWGDSSLVARNAWHGIYNEAGSTAYIISSTISENTWNGLYNETGSAAYIDSSTISGNDRGGIDNRPGTTLTIVNSTISENNRRGIDNYSSVKVWIDNSTILGNNGGGIDHRGDELTVTNSTIAGNGSQGIVTYSSAMLTVINSRIERNTYAGINSNGTTTVTNSTILGNDTHGIENNSGFSLTVINSLVAGNKYAGIFNYGSVTVKNSTIAGNRTRGIDNGYGATTTVTNSIIWGNQASFELLGTFTVSSSVVEDGFADGTNIITDDPLFVAPVEYTDAPTKAGDYRLQAASPAINAGSTPDIPADVHDLDGDDNKTERVPFDLAGNPRVRSTIVDIGAYEHTVDAGVNTDKASVSVAEGGATDSVATVLLARPGAPVTLTITTGGQVLVDPTELVFTPDNWATPQSITVMALDDLAPEGPHTDVIEMALSSDHADYNGYSVTVDVNVTDNERLEQELLHNGGFEDKVSGTKLPEAWKVKAPKSIKVLCKPDKANTGNCALKFRHGTPIRGIVTQDIDLTGLTLLADDQLILSVYVRDGKTPARVKTVLKVIYADGSKDKVKKGLTSDVGYELATLPALTLRATPTAVRVRFAHKTPNAALTIDDASLTLVPPLLSRRGGGSDLILPPPALPDGFRGTN